MRTRDKSTYKDKKNVKETFKIMGNFRKIFLISFAAAMLLGSCSGSHNTYKKRRKKAPCDCPKFNYVPHNDNVRNYVMYFVGDAGFIIV